MRHLIGLLALVALLVCFVSPFLYLWQTVSMGSYKAILAVASAAWFVFATIWVSRR